jgi:mitogen-activated protein kinase kinase kinase
MSSRTSVSSYRAPLAPDAAGDESPGGEAVPRVSISTDSGSEASTIDESALDAPTRSSYSKRASTSSTLSLLPPVKLPAESLSDSLTDLTLIGDAPSSRPVSRSFSNASKRMSLITELRSKRDRSDAASLMTVDEITAEVESRRESAGDLIAVVAEKEPSSADEWTQVAFEDGSKDGTDGDTDSMLEPQEIFPDTVAEETDVEDDEEEDDEDEDEYEDEDEEDDGGEAEDELTDDEPNKAITSRQGGAFHLTRPRPRPTVFLSPPFLGPQRKPSNGSRARLSVLGPSVRCTSAWMLPRVFLWQ